jgi:FAD/FMN-containing dehydrogenase
VSIGLHHQLKQVFDPLGLLNPGKMLVPSPADPRVAAGS